MKKLLTLIGAAATAFGLYAVVPAESSIKFDTATLGSFDFTAQDSGGYYWWATDLTEITGTVTAYETPPTPNNSKYLALETGSDPIFRTAASVSVATETRTVQQADITDGVYFEQRVKFTAFEDEPPALAADAKIAVWLKADESETNLYVSTAVLADDLTVAYTTNLVLNVNPKVEPDSWHKLRISTIPAYFSDNGVTTDVVPGFVVSIDDELVSVSETTIPASAGEGALKPAGAAAKLIAEKKLLASRVAYNDDAGGKNPQTLTGVGYQGAGAIDEIFAGPGNDFVFTTDELTVPAHCAEIVLTSTNEYDVVDNGDGTWTIVRGDAIRVTFVAAEGYSVAPTSMVFDNVTEDTEFDFSSVVVTKDSYPVSFYDQNESFLATTNVAAGTVVLPIAAPAAPAGKSFKGWCETNGEEFVLFNFNTVITNALDLFAQYTNNIYTVTFMSESAEYASQSIENGQTATKPATDPTAAGKTFVEWQENGVAFNFSTAITNDLTLTAYFTVDAYTLTLTPGDNATLTASPVGPYTYDTSVTLTATPQSSEYEFATVPTGWTKVGDSLTKQISVTASETIVGPDAVKKAPVIVYHNITITTNATVTYVAKFDDGTAVTFDNDVATVEDGTNVTIIATAVSGYTFASQPTGWTGTGSSVTNVISAINADVAVTLPTATQAGWDPDPTTIEPASKTAGDEYPALDGTALANANARQLTAWANTTKVAFSAVTANPGDYVEAFLLNCGTSDVAAEKAAFKLDITVDGSGKISVSLPAGKEYNGTLQMKGSNNLSTWENVTGETGHTTSDYQFFKYELSL